MILRFPDIRPEPPRSEACVEVKTYASFNIGRGYRMIVGIVQDIPVDNDAASEGERLVQFIVDKSHNSFDDGVALAIAQYSNVVEVSE